MPISFQSIINSRFGVGLALGLGRSTPPRLGYRIASFVARQISARPKLGLVQAVRGNQAVVGAAGFSGAGRLSSAELDQRVTETFVQTGYCLYDLYHNLRNPAAIRNLLAWSPDIDRFVESRQHASQGLTIVGVHMSNFDFVAQAATQRGLRVMSLGLPNPGGGYQWQNDLRKKAGFEVVPASVNALRQATRLLEQGGTVMTGLDRPLAEFEIYAALFRAPGCTAGNAYLVGLENSHPGHCGGSFPRRTQLLSD